MTIVALCLVAAPPVAGAQAATFTGQLQELHSHRFDRTVFDQGWRIVNGAAQRTLSEPQPASLVGETVTVTDADPHTPVLEGRVRATTGARAAVEPATGPRSVLVLLVTTPDATTPPGDPATVREAIFTNPASAGSFFVQQSDGATSLTGLVNGAGDVGHVAISQPLRGCDYGAIGSAARAAADQQGWDTAAYDHRIYIHPYSAECGYAGRGSMPGNDVWSNGQSGWYVISHELGHNMGAHHASALECVDTDGDPVALSDNCESTEYADPFDVMGVGGLMGAWHRSQIGQLATQTTSLRQSASHTLSSADGPATGLQSLLVPIKVPHVPVTRWYALDFRSARTPFNPFGVGSAATTGITIRIVPALDERVQTQLIDTNANASGAHDDAPLQPGATFTDAEHDIAIHARATGGQTIGVDVTMPVLVDDIPPSAVGFLNAGGDTNAVSLFWGAAGDDESVDHYDVIRDGATIGSTGGLSLVDTAATALVSATYEVVAVDPTGNRGPAVSREVTLPDATPPTAVASLAASAAPTGVSLRWPAASDNRGVTAYSVQRDGVIVAAPAGLSFSERPSAGRHRYAVQAVDAAANHGIAATAEITMPAPASTDTTGPAGADHERATGAGRVPRDRLQARRGHQARVAASASPGARPAQDHDDVHVQPSLGDARIHRQPPPGPAPHVAGTGDVHAVAAPEPSAARAGRLRRRRRHPPSRRALSGSR